MNPLINLILLVLIGRQIYVNKGRRWRTFFFGLAAMLVAVICVIMVTGSTGEQLK
jgi:hypothetical protein